MELEVACSKYPGFAPKVPRDMRQNSGSNADADDSNE